MQIRVRDEASRGIRPFRVRSAPPISTTQAQLLGELAELAGVQAVGYATINELRSLSTERDPRVLSECLLNLARREEQRQDLNFAGLLYSAVIRLNASEDFVRRANAALRVLQGEGSFGARFENLSRQFVQQATDPSLLVGMGVAGAVFQATRFAVLSRLLSSPSTGCLTRGMSAQALAWGVGFGLEFPAFTFAVRGMNQVLGRPQDWSLGAVGSDLARAGITLAALKITGLAGHTAIRRVAASGSNPVARLSQAAIPQLSMFTGIVGAHAAEVGLGLRPATDMGTTLIDSAATLLQFNVSGRILGRLLSQNQLRAEQLARLDSGSSEGRRRMLPILAFEPLVETGSRVGEHPAKAGILQMSSEIGNGGAGSGEGPRRTLPRGSDSKPWEQLPLGTEEQYFRFRKAIGRIEGDLQEAFTHENGEFLWVHPAYRQVGELHYLVDRVESSVTPSYRTEEFLEANRQIRAELRGLLDILDPLRRLPVPSYSTPAVSKFLSKLYTCPNAFVGFLLSGDISGPRTMIETLRLARESLKTTLPPGFEPATTNPSELIDSRPWWDPLTAHASPHYEFPETGSLDFLEIPGNHRRVLLAGDVPSVRASLSKTHRVEIHSPDIETYYHLMGEAQRTGNLSNIRNRRQLVRPGSEAVDYLEIYDHFGAEAGIEFLAQDLLGNLKVGGIGYFVSHNRQTMERIVDQLTHHGIADILSGGLQSVLPVKSRRPDAAASNYIFIRKLAR